MLSKRQAVGESRTIGGRSLRQKSVAVATVMENVMNRVEAPCWRNTLETLPQRKIEVPDTERARTESSRGSYK
jgi:hypothetical protein